MGFRWQIHIYIYRSIRIYIFLYIGKILAAGGILESLKRHTPTPATPIHPHWYTYKCVRIYTSPLGRRSISRPLSSTGRNVYLFVNIACTLFFRILCLITQQIYHISSAAGPRGVPAWTYNGKGGCVRIWNISLGDMAPRTEGVWYFWGRSCKVIILILVRFKTGSCQRWI